MGSSARKEARNKKMFDPNKPKRIIIYKDDLPGFNLDADLEDEKLPVSKRGNTEGETNKKTKLKEKKKSPVKEAAVSDEDVESVESFSSTSSVTKKRRKTNKTGFPTPKKKKKSGDAANSSTSVKETPKKP